MKILSDSHITRGSGSLPSPTPPKSFRFVKNPDMERFKWGDRIQNHLWVALCERSIRAARNIDLWVEGGNPIRRSLLTSEELRVLMARLFRGVYSSPDSYILPCLVYRWNYVYFVILGGVNNYGTFLLQICLIMFQKFPKIPRKITMMFQICHIFLISFPVLSKVPLDLADVYRPNRNYIHPCAEDTHIVWQKKDWINIEK